jgi:hypothetical protein
MVSGSVDIRDGGLDGILQRCCLSMKLHQSYVAVDQEGGIPASPVDVVHLGFVAQTLVDTQCEFDRFHDAKLLFWIVLATVHSTANVAGMMLWDTGGGLHTKNMPLPIASRAI